MSKLTDLAKAEASKYQHMISAKSLHKYDFGCGANAEGGGGFQPGNTCGGDGDGKDDKGDQGGGDKPKKSMPKNNRQQATDALKKADDLGLPNEQHAMVEELIDEGDYEMAIELISDWVEAEGLDPTPVSGEHTPAMDKFDDAMSNEDHDALISAYNDLSEDEKDSLGQDERALVEDLKSDSEQATRDAEIAGLQEQIAEQQSALDAEIAENYKDVTEEDIQDMLDEKDITAAEAEEMRGWVAQAQEAQADAPASGAGELKHLDKDLTLIDAMADNYATQASEENDPEEKDVKDWLNEQAEQLRSLSKAVRDKDFDATHAIYREMDSADTDDFSSEFIDFLENPTGYLADREGSADADEPDDSGQILDMSVPVDRETAEEEIGMFVGSLEAMAEDIRDEEDGSDYIKDLDKTLADAKKALRNISGNLKSPARAIRSLSRETVDMMLDLEDWDSSIQAHLRNRLRQRS